jgi:hypothetical protein
MEKEKNASAEEETAEEKGKIQVSPACNGFC